jgi:hypothetical protein
MAKNLSPHVLIDVDLRDYIDWPLVGEAEAEELERAFLDLDRARACLSARAPDLQEALLRLERGLPVLSEVMARLR